MIQLTPNTENLIILSFDAVTIEDPTYLIRFKSNESEVDYTCIISPVDTYEFGRLSFIVETVASGADNLAGQIVLPYGDEYQYYVYAQTSTTNLDWTLADEEIDKGIMKYNKTIAARNVYERQPTTRKVYTRS